MKTAWLAFLMQSRLYLSTLASSIVIVIVVVMVIVMRIHHENSLASSPDADQAIPEYTSIQHLAEAMSRLASS